MVNDPDVPGASLRHDLTEEQFQSVIGAARTGAEWAWTGLYRNLAPAVLGYLRAQRVPEPEDLTAEVFLQVVKSLGRFEGTESEFRSWIFVIAHRKIIDDILPVTPGRPILPRSRP